ncbi:hypothetical protein EYC84_005951 [Monilinia fructicola]|uniref:Uncharacterized protein n=1 Tax=Monilinia fructicola TaxID=38448 RepID=A0A5M9K0U2_MONFR|nr:hypothetical protein EYC84_005951 [Monilinia fructicola]
MRPEIYSIGFSIGSRYVPSKKQHHDSNDSPLVFTLVHSAFCDSSLTSHYIVNHMEGGFDSIRGVRYTKKSSSLELLVLFLF